MLEVLPLDRAPPYSTIQNSLSPLLICVYLKVSFDPLGRRLDCFFEPGRFGLLRCGLSLSLSLGLFGELFVQESINDRYAR